MRNKRSIKDAVLGIVNPGGAALSLWKNLDRRCPHEMFEPRHIAKCPTNCNLDWKQHLAEVACLSPSMFRERSSQYGRVEPRMQQTISVFVLERPMIYSLSPGFFHDLCIFHYRADKFECELVQGSYICRYVGLRKAKHWVDNGHYDGDIDSRDYAELKK